MAERQKSQALTRAEALSLHELKEKATIAAGTALILSIDFMDDIALERQGRRDSVVVQTRLTDGLNAFGNVLQGAARVLSIPEESR